MSKEVTAIWQSIRTLTSVRNQWLMGEGPASVMVDGFTFKDELEAEEYLAELNARLEELRQPIGGEG